MSNGSHRATVRTLATMAQEEKAMLLVSKHSRFGYRDWDFSDEIPNKNRNPGAKVIRFEQLGIAIDARSHDRFSGLVDSVKCLLYSLIDKEVRGGAKFKYSTLVHIFGDIKELVKWMKANGYDCFAKLDKEACDAYVSYILGRSLAPLTKVQRLAILTLLFEERSNLPDFINTHPFNYRSAFEIVGVTPDMLKAAKTKYIPEEIISPLLVSAFDHVENKAERLIRIQGSIEKIKSANAEASKSKLFNLISGYLSAEGFPSTRSYYRERNRLMTACYIIVAFASGMRDSESISIEEHCVKKVRSKNGKWIYRLTATTYKTFDQPKTDYWMVPAAVKNTVDVLSRLTAHLRAGSGRRELFLVKRNNNIKCVTNSVINGWLKQFLAAAPDVPLHNGKQWRIHTHQFRRSFAYYMMKEDRCNLKFLRDQFKHFTMDMTIWYAETGDHDLIKEVYAMSDEIAREILRPMLFGTAPLAGKGGEQIAKNREAYFAGKTMKEKESLFVEPID